MAINLRDFGAVGDGQTNDGPAIQAAIDKMYAEHGGGRIDIPPGNYLTAQTIEVKGGVVLMGESEFGCSIRCSPGADQGVLYFGPTCRGGCGMERLSVIGRQTAESLADAIRNATRHVVTVEDNVPVIFRDCQIWGGRSGIFTKGADGTYDNLFVMGRVASVWSQGANWWIRCKLDNANELGGQAFYADRPEPGSVLAGAARENRFVLCDFTGNYTFSLGIADPGFAGAFIACVMGNPIQVNQATSLQLLGCSMGTGFVVEGAAAGRVVVVGNETFGSPDPITGAVPGQVVGAANDGVT